MEIQSLSVLLNCTCLNKQSEGSMPTFLDAASHYNVPLFCDIKTKKPILPNILMFNGESTSKVSLSGFLLGIGSSRWWAGSGWLKK